MPLPATLDAAALPAGFADVEALEEFMSRPGPALADDMAALDGDLMVLGVAGKMGPTLARLARRAAPGRRVIGVARFSDAAVRARLEAAGVETMACDLLDRAALQALPDAPHIVFAAALKFGATADPGLTWAMNCHVPALVAERFAGARSIVAFSTGNVYPLTASEGPGANEATPTGPVGEYAQSCLGRERMFQYFSGKLKTPGRLFRLNYAVDLRYGVLHDLARRILAGEPVDVTMGHVNLIWQGDANTQVLRALRQATVPTTPLNCTGLQTLSVRWLATELAARLQRPLRLTGQEAPNALLSDAREAARLFGPPSVPIDTLLDWVADWVARDMPSLNKPTKFEVRDGKF